MFTRVLIPCGLADPEEPALAMAARLAGADAELTLLHVIEPILGLDFEEGRDFYEPLEARARERLLALATALEPHAGALKHALVYGHRTAEIVRYAQDQGHDLIVMASRRIDAEHLEDGHWSTLSHQVAILSPCPVLLVK